MRRQLLLCIIALAAGILVPAGALPAPSRARSAAALRASLKGTNVIILALDAARADHFGCYGYARQTTPNADRLARESRLFARHFCEVGLTKPSTLSLVTGQYPATHGLLDNWQRPPAPSPSLFTLEGAFARAGYATYLLTTTPVLVPGEGMVGDFQHPQVPPHLVPGRKPGPDWVGMLRAQVGRALPEWKKPGARFFAYLHLMPPHPPYDPPTATRKEFQKEPLSREQVRAGVDRQECADYDADLRWADSAIGELVRALRQAGLLEHTLLIITADHGQSLGEHGIEGHGTSPYEDVHRIPLLVRFPGRAKPTGRCSALTQTIDLFPTLLDLYQLPAPRGKLQGKSLVPLLTGEKTAVNDAVIGYAPFSRCYTLREERFSLAVYQTQAKRELYDLETDPWQLHNLAATQPARAAAMERLLRSRLQGQRHAGLRPDQKAGTRASGRLSEEHKKALRGLGYVK